MFQRLILILKQKELFTPALFVLALLLVLSLIIILGQFFHQSLQEEMAGQFNQQQLLLAREVAMNIESFVDRVYKSLRVISQLPEIDRIHLSPRCRSVAESINFSLQNEALIAIRVLDKNGILLFDSSFPGRKPADFSKTDYFRKARVLPKNEKLITDLFEVPDQGQGAKEFIIAAPIYQYRKSRPAPEFRGVVLAVLSMEGITRKYLSPIKSGTRGYAWMMDSNGTLLYHPDQPRMVGKNLYQTDRTCFQCHTSFDAEKKMIEGKFETFGSYEAPGGENKLAAYYKFPIVRKSWIVVVSAPYSEVIALMRKSRSFYALLILSIFITTLVASGALVVNYKKKIKAEEKAKHLENQRRLERELEEALKRYTVELEDKVDKGTATAKKLEQQIMHSEKLAALGRLAAGVAHEIGNPLTSISTFAQLLREMATDEFSQSSLDIINNHIQRITDIVRRMSTFARADSMNSKYLQLNDVLQSTLDLMHLDKRMKSAIEIVVSLDAGLPKTMIDEGQMSQVFINIILNALDAMHEGGTLSVASRAGHDDSGRESIMISFADTGAGIPRDSLEKIFDPFYTTKESGKGTGLGLSVSYNIVKQFKGDIKVESEAGRETVFTIILPVEKESA